MGGDMLTSRRRVKQGLKRGDFEELGEIPTTCFNGKLSHHRVVDATKFDGCPVNVRSEDEKDAGGNMVGMMTTRLNTDIADPLERLQAVHNDALNAKAHLEAQGARMIADFSENMPAALQSLLVQVSAAAGMTEKNVMINTIVTNVPGSPVQLYMCGAKIIDSFGMGPLSPGVGLFHTVNSMVMKDKGTLTLSFICCRDVMPDPEFYAQCLEESFEELARATQPAKKQKRTRKRA
jgi:hypothetical protein